MQEPSAFYDHGHFLKLLNAEDVPGAAATLRALVDGWIASGFDAAGNESPAMRKLPDEERQRLMRYLGPALTWVRPDGNVEYTYQFAPHRCGEDKRLSLDDMRGYYEFAKFLAMGGRKYHLSRCGIPHCQKPYFYRQHLQSLYKRGSGCPEHRAQAITLRARFAEREELLALAVQFWPEWTERKHPNRALWVAQQVSEGRKGAERRITQKWVSRNKVAIQAMAEKGGKR